MSFESLDTNGDGHVSKEEFEAWQARQKVEKPQTSWLDLFSCGERPQTFQVLPPTWGPVPRTACNPLCAGNAAKQAYPAYVSCLTQVKDPVAVEFHMVSQQRAPHLDQLEIQSLLTLVSPSCKAQGCAPPHNAVIRRKPHLFMMISLCDQVTDAAEKSKVHSQPSYHNP